MWGKHLLVTMAAVCSMTAPASAAQIVQSKTFDFTAEATFNGIVDDPRRGTKFNLNDTTITTFVFDGFDPALGKITGFNLSLDADQSLTAGVSFPAIRVPKYGEMSAWFTTSLVVGPYAIAIGELDIPNFVIDAFTADPVALLVPKNGAFDFSTSGNSLGNKPITFQLINRVHAEGYFRALDPHPANAAVTGRSSGSLTLTYDYDPASPVLPGVPEPSTWMMLICGFGVAGASLRRRHARVRMLEPARANR